MDLHRTRQKMYRDHMQKKKFQQLQDYHKQMQEKVFKDPYGLNALTRLIVGPRGIFGHHIYKTVITSQGPKGINNYNVYEAVDEGNNPFTWPKWLGFGNIFNNLQAGYVEKKQQNKEINNSRRDEKLIEIVDDENRENTDVTKSEVTTEEIITTKATPKYYKDVYIIARRRDSRKKAENEPDGNEIEDSSNRSTIIRADPTVETKIIVTN